MYGTLRVYTLRDRVDPPPIITVGVENDCDIGEDA